MAIVVESVSSGSVGTANPATLQIAKPTGLAVGDLMVAAIGYTGTLNAPAGWTSIRSQSNAASGYKMEAFYQIADSSDVAASTFDFSTAASGSVSGGILRISGFYPTTPIATSNSAEVDADSTPSYAITVTPSYAESLLIYCVGVGGELDVSTYAVTTSNPSWTEKFDVGTVMTTAVATATRTEITATGNATCDFGTPNDSIGIMVVVNPIQNATISPAVIQVTTTVQTQTTQVGVTLTPSVVSVTTTLQTATPEMKTRWSTTSKSSTTWTNLDKTST